MFSSHLFTFNMQYRGSQGVKFHLDGRVERIIASKSDPKFSTGAELTNEDCQKLIIETDPVVVGDGVSPSTEFPETATGPTRCPSEGWWSSRR